MNALATDTNVMQSVRTLLAGSIDYDQLGCTPTTVFDDDKCQKIVLRGKDTTAGDVARYFPFSATSFPFFQVWRTVNFFRSSNTTKSAQ